MAHELTIRANGAAEMAYLGETPWHGLGQPMQPGASIEEWIRAAGMDWNIRRSVARFFADEDTRRDCFELCAVPGETVLFRSDNRAPLGIVSPDYNIVQPAQVLEFFRDLVAENGAQLETAGTLFGGRRFWALAKLAAEPVHGADVVGGYLLLCTSADGTMATEARETTVRVVCNNTLRMARGADAGPVAPVRIPHSAKFDDRAIKARLSMAGENFARAMETARRLAAVRVTEAAAAQFVRDLLRPGEAAEREAAAKRAAEAAEAARKLAAAAGKDPAFASMVATVTAAETAAASDAAKRRAPRGEAQILELFRGGAMGGQLPGASGTAWGLVNAVTEYVDHHATAKTTDHRISSAWFGDGDKLKERALVAALQLA